MNGLVCEWLVVWICGICGKDGLVRVKTGEGRVHVCAGMWAVGLGVCCYMC